MPTVEFELVSDSEKDEETMRVCKKCEALVTVRRVAPCSAHCQRQHYMCANPFCSDRGNASCRIHVKVPSIPDGVAEYCVARGWPSNPSELAWSQIAEIAAHMGALKAAEAKTQKP